VSAICTRTFAYPLIVYNKAQINDTVAICQADLNNFLATILPQDVLSIIPSWNSIGKYGEISLYQVVVVFLAQ
jgi:hypothetical protein